MTNLLFQVLGIILSICSSQYPVLESHYETLMETSVAELISGLDMKYETVERYAEAQAHIYMNGNRSQKAMSKQLHNFITTFRGLGNSTNGHRFTLMIACVMVLMKVPLDSLFVFFDVSFETLPTFFYPTEAGS